MCYRNKTIGVVVPVFNEELVIGEALRSIPKYVDRIYVVDDCSRDGTAEIIREFEFKDPRFICINHEQNKGIGAAIITGYKKALEDEIDIAAVMSGDNAMDPQRLPELLDPIVDGEADYSKGNRLLYSESRTLGNTILTFLTKIASGYWHIMDPQNGYTAISIKALERIDPDNIYPKFGYCNDLLVRLNVFGFKVIDVVMPAKYGKVKSKIRYGRHISEMSFLLMRDFLWRLKIKYAGLEDVKTPEMAAHSPAPCAEKKTPYIYANNQSGIGSATESGAKSAEAAKELGKANESQSGLELLAVWNKLTNKEKVDSGMRRFTKVSFPDKCVLNENVELSIQLVIKSEIDTVIKRAIDIPFQRSSRNIRLTLVVTATEFDIDNRRKYLVVPIDKDSEKVIFNMVPRKLGNNFVELEIFSNATRIGYITFETEVIESMSSNEEGLKVHA